jgi:hypothetical protein
MKKNLNDVLNKTFARFLLDVNERDHNQASEITWKID